MNPLIATCITAITFGITTIILTREAQRQRRAVDAIIITLNTITRYLEAEQEARQNGIR